MSESETTSPTTNAVDAAQLLRRQERLAGMGGTDVTDVTVVIGFRDASGARHEITRQVEDGANHRIVKCAHSVEEQMVAKKVEGDIVGFEPTGKCVLKLDVVFIQN